MSVETTLKVRVVPNARRNEIVGAYGDAVKVKVQAPAMDGKANAALLEFLASQLGLPVSDLQVVQGGKSRSKVIAITGLDAGEARRRLGA